MLNQDIHKNLRRNKHGIRLEEVEPLQINYKRPSGFSVVPNLLGNNQMNRKSSYFDHVQEEMLRYIRT